MRVFFVACLIAASVVAAPADDKPVNYNALNKELDQILAASANINSMSQQELLELSARVDGTLKELEEIAQTRLGLDINSRKSRSPQDAPPPAPPAQQPGLLNGLGGAANIIQMLSQMFASLGQRPQSRGAPEHAHNSPHEQHDHEH